MKATQRQINRNERNNQIHFTIERNEGRREEMPFAFIMIQMVHTQLGVMFLQQQTLASKCLSVPLLLYIINIANGAWKMATNYH
jgi:hypothetical protein